QIQVFNGHSNMVNTVGYSPFVTKNSSEISSSRSNVICSTSDDNTIRFWDVRSNKKELYLIEGDKEDNGIICVKFISLKKKLKNNKQKLSGDYDGNLFYGINKVRFKIIYVNLECCLIYFFLTNKKEQFNYEFMNKLLDVSNGLKKQLFVNVFFCISIQLERE
ncbi:hypothetical protein RFI_34195, partial [Reticulomyxa filosa]